MESELDPVVSTSANAPAGASPGARFLVGLALVACWLTVLAPLSAIAAFFVVIMLVAGAAFVQLHSGGFALEPFTICVWLGLVCAVLVIFGSWIRNAAAPEGKEGHPFKQRLAALLGLGSVVNFAEWDGNAWLPDALSSFFVLCGLFLLLAALPLALLWGGVRLAVALYRWSRASAFVAGVVTALAGLLAAGSVATCSAERPPGSHDEPPAISVARKVLRAAVEAEGFSETIRALLMETAKTLHPEVFQRRMAQDGRGAELRRSPALPAAPAPALPAASLDPEVSACMEQIVREKSERGNLALEDYARGIRGSHPYIPEDEVKELVVDTMLEVCLAHDRAVFRSVQAIFLINLNRRAVDRSRKARRDCSLLGEYAACQLGEGDWMREPELDALHDMLCGLKPNERAILVLRVIMGMRFAEIGAAVELTENKAREIFNNTRRRLKRQLEDRCRASTWGMLE